MGTDMHRNSFPDLLSDGERGDSYRRMALWFSNHLLVTPPAGRDLDDRDLKAALRAGRLYGVFEAMGYAQGFDYRAETAGAVAEMGGQVALPSAPVLRVRRPSVAALDPKRTPPAIRLRVMRANDSDTEPWVEAAAGAGDLEFRPTQPGAYRAEARMLPLHLREDLGGDADTLLEHDYPWVYSNAIYVE